MKIFRMNECDWWIGPTLEACVADYINEVGDSVAVEDARALTDAELDRLHYIDTDEEDRPVSDRRTFRQQLAIEIEQGGTFPRMFATTEI